MKSKIASHRLFVLLVSAILITPPTFASHYLATWTNGNLTELWSDSANWDIGVVPLNDTDTYDVVIPAGYTVYYDVDPNSQITDLDLASTGVLYITAGHILTVLDDAAIDGKVYAGGADSALICPSAGATLGDSAILQVTGSSKIESAATTYASTANANITTFSANDSLSLLDLSSLESINSGFSHSYRTHTISAQNNGTVDLSSVGTVIGPTHGGSKLLFYIGSGGDIDLSSLTDTLSGYTYFDINGASYSLPSLENTTGTTIDVDGTTSLSMPNLHTFDSGSFVFETGSTISVPSLTNFTNSSMTLDPAYTFVTGTLTNIDDSRIAVTGGKQFGSAEIDVVTFNSTGNATYNILSASGTNSALDLSSLHTINAGFAHSYRTHTISATDHGAIDLSKISSVYGPTHSGSRLRFEVNSGAGIDLSGLLDIQSGYTTFDIDIAYFTLPVLYTGSGVTFDVGESAFLYAPKLKTLTNSSIVIADTGSAALGSLDTFTNSSFTLDPSKTLIIGTLTDIDNSVFAFSGGQQFGYSTGQIDTASYIVNVTGNVTIFSASGAGTNFDLSCLTSINSAYGHSYVTKTISAADQASIDLSNVDIIYGPTHGGSALKFVVDSDADINLDSLDEIPSGHVYFDIGVPYYALPSLQTATGLTLDASEISTIDANSLQTLDTSSIVIADGGTINAPMLSSFTNSTLTLDPSKSLTLGTLSNIDNSRFYLSGGQQFGTAYGDIDASGYAATAAGTLTILSATGESTVLDMSSLTEINGAFTASYTTKTISAADSSLIDFSSVTNIYGPTHSASVLKLSATGGGRMIFGGDLGTINHVMFDLVDSASELIIGGNFNLNSPAAFAATEGAAITIGGDFAFNMTTESSMNMDNAFLTMTGSDSMLEVAGDDLGSSATSGVNFGIAQLTVGDGTTPAKVTLVDLIDNGNQTSGPESLYLYGSGGLNGLVIEDGCQLIIGNINVYVMVDGQMENLADYFTEGVKWIPFDNGIITITDYTCSLASDLTGDCFVDLSDLGVMAGEWLSCGDPECE